MEAINDMPDNESTAFALSLLKLSFEQRRDIMAVLKDRHLEFHAKVSRSLLGLKNKSLDEVMSSTPVKCEIDVDSSTVLVLYANGSYLLNEGATVFAGFDDWAKRRENLGRGAVSAFRQLQQEIQVMNSREQLLYASDAAGNVSAVPLHQAQEQTIMSDGKPFRLTSVAIEILKIFNRLGHAPLSYEEAARRATEGWRPTTLLARWRAWRNREKA